MKVEAPSVLFPGPVCVKCVDCVPGGFSARLCSVFQGDFCRTSNLYTSAIPSFLSHCPLNLVPFANSQFGCFFVHSQQGCLFGPRCHLIFGIWFTYLHRRYAESLGIKTTQTASPLSFDSFLWVFVACIVLYGIRGEQSVYLPNRSRHSLQIHTMKKILKFKFSTSEAFSTCKQALK